MSLYGLFVFILETVTPPPIFDENGVFCGCSTPPENRCWQLGEKGTQFALGYYRNKSDADRICNLLKQQESLYEGQVTVEIFEYDISILDRYQSKVAVDTFYGEGCVNADSELVFDVESALIFLAA
jgi:hypothetical protein